MLIKWKVHSLQKCNVKCFAPNNVENNVKVGLISERNIEKYTQTELQAPSLNLFDAECMIYSNFEQHFHVHRLLTEKHISLPKY
jgi:hypothetical protein